MTYDVSVQNHGTIHLVIPETDAAREWLEQHTDAQWYAGGAAVEPRYTVLMLQGMRHYGFDVPLQAQ